MRTARWRYNRWGTAGEELYDHDSDPQECANLTKKTGHAKTLEEMRALLDAAHKRSMGQVAGSGGPEAARPAAKKKKRA